MKRAMRLGVVVIVATFVLVGCASRRPVVAPTPNIKTQQANEIMHTQVSVGGGWFQTLHVSVVHDDKRKVTCWIANPDHGDSPSISCLPDSQIAKGA